MEINTLTIRLMNTIMNMCKTYNIDAKLFDCNSAFKHVLNFKRYHMI